jgi:hydrogenase-4 component H
MLKLIKLVANVGEATTQYPLAPIDLAPGFRGKPVHEHANCIACGACTLACPPNAISMDTDVEHGVRTWSIFYGRCIFCGRCEEVCPTGAISLTPDFELAAFNKADLIVRADYKLTACTCCQRYFAPAKELAYALDILVQSGLPENEKEYRRSMLEVCPDCRRKNDVERIKALGRLPEMNP